MSRYLEQTNRLVDRIATVAAILSLGADIVDLRNALKGESRLPYPSDGELCEQADDLLNAAAEYVERRSERERTENDLSEPGAMPKNTGKYQPEIPEADQREIDTFKAFLKRIAEVRASPAGRTTTAGEVYDEVYREHHGPTEPERMPKNTRKHPENLEKPEKPEPEPRTFNDALDVVLRGNPSTEALLDQLDVLLSGKPTHHEAALARTTADILRRRFAELVRQDASFSAVTPELVGAVAKAFWAEFEGVPWDAARFLKSERYAGAAVQAIKAARAVARGNTVAGQGV